MNLKNSLFLFAMTLCLSCGTTHTVISDDGKVYEVKGDTFINNGQDVTETLSSDEKNAIKSNLEQRLNRKEKAEERQEQLEDQQKELEKAQEEARKKQQELAEQQKELEETLRDKEQARSEYLKAKELMKSKQNRFKRLKDKGKLSPNDVDDWEKKLLDYQKDIDDAQKRLNSFE